MAATDINPAVRYDKTLNSTVYFCPTMADYNNPTRAELDAGTRIDGVIPRDGISGFSGTEQTDTSDDIRTGDTIPVHAGTDWSGGSTINSHLSKTGTDLRDVMPVGTDGYLVLFDSQDTAGRKMDVFPIFVGSIQKARQGVAMATWGLSFTGTPATDVTVPA